MSKTYDVMIDNLVKEIRHHRDLYNNGQPEISDSEFDALVAQLRENDPEHEALTEVGAPVSRNSPLSRVKLSRRCGSLDNAMTESAFRKWFEKMEKMARA
jgi:DNA ligase (NAD+)